MSDVQSMLTSVIGAGKATVLKIGAKDIRRFIENQPDVDGDVEVTVIGDGGEVGASNGTVLFDARFVADGSARELVLRHAPGSETRLFFDYDLARQFRVQRALYGSSVPVPQPLWVDADGRWLGVPGYVMERVHGRGQHPAAFIQGPIAEASPSDRQEMLGQVMKALVGIHNTDINAAGLEDFTMKAPGGTPLERLVNWYWQTWEWVHLPEFERLVPARRWLLANIPDGETELMHGDSTLQNYFFDGKHLAAVLDWEMSSLGRAEADLALQCVSNQLFAAPPESGLLQPPSEEEWLAMYHAAGGRPLRDFEYFKKLAAFMIIVAVSALQRNMSDSDRAAQEPLLRPCWQLVEA
jgi:aminoglycoside phosphotransferase (APT) family kinase protein